MAQVPQPVQSIVARLRMPASLFSVETFSSAPVGQALIHGAASHLRQIKAKRIISSSESTPLF
jgi:hypothetical protein